MKFHKPDTVPAKKITGEFSLSFVDTHLQSKCLLIFLEKQFTMQIKHTKNKFVNVYLLIYIVLEFE